MKVLIHNRQAEPYVVDVEPMLVPLIMDFNSMAQRLELDMGLIGEIVLKKYGKGNNAKAK